MSGQAQSVFVMAPSVILLQSHREEERAMSNDGFRQRLAKLASATDRDSQERLGCLEQFRRIKEVVAEVFAAAKEELDGKGAIYRLKVDRGHERRICLQVITEEDSVRAVYPDHQIKAEADPAYELRYIGKPVFPCVVTVESAFGEPRNIPAEKITPDSVQEDVYDFFASVLGGQRDVP